MTKRVRGNVVCGSASSSQSSNFRLAWLLFSDFLWFPMNSKDFLWLTALLPGWPCPARLRFRYDCYDALWLPMNSYDCLRPARPNTGGRLRFLLISYDGIDFHWFSYIFIYFHGYSVMCIDWMHLKCFSSILIDVHWLPLISINICWIMCITLRR